MAPSIGETFLATAARYPDKPAIIDGETALTYREYAGAALSVAAALGARNAPERVALLMPTSAPFAIAFFGIILSGRTPVPLNFFLAGEELAFIVADCGARLVIASRFFEKQAEGIGAEAVLAEDFLPEALKSAPAKAAAANHFAVIPYTSGTTGRPKGVLLSHGNILANVFACAEHFNFTSEHVILGMLPFFHTFALTTTLVVPAAVGATAVLLPRFEGSAAIRAVTRHKVTAIMAVPSMYRALARTLERADADMSRVRLPISGGEPLPEEVFETYQSRFGVTIYEGYGMTETSPVIAGNTPGASRPLTVGRPLPGVEVRVVNDQGQDAGVNADGEIWVRGESVMEGYLNLPDETESAITGNAFFRTGDIGRFDPDGFLKITGRKKEMMISAGENIFPREIEIVLARHEAVAEAAVIGIPDDVRGEAPKAFVVVKPGKNATADELKEFCRQHIARFKVPSEIEFRDEFPHGPTGKILKQRLVPSYREASGGDR